MSELKASRTARRAARYSAAAWLVLCALAAGPAAAQTCNSASKCLSLGLFYYNNDDTSDRAAKLFRTVTTTYRQSVKEAETAQYYLASYYQRKYYVQRERTRREDRTALQAALAEYLRYTDTYIEQKSGRCKGTCQWLADAFFNRALVFKQLGDTKNAGYELDKLRAFAKLDGSVYVYQIVWSPRYEDVVDGYLPAAALAQSAQGLLSSFPDANAFMAALKKWCQQNRSRRAAVDETAARLTPA